MNVTYRKLSELTKLQNNPRRIEKEDMERLKSSIRKFWVIPWRPFLLSDRTGELVIIGGNMRYDACKDLGIEDVPTFLMSGLTEEQEREIIIRDNISNGDWDIWILESDWSNDPLSEWWLEVEFEKEQEKEDIEDNVPKEPEAIYVQEWDIFRLGKHTLMCGNSMKEEDINKLLKDKPEWKTHCISDPPYGISYTNDKHGMIKNDDKILDYTELGKKYSDWFFAMWTGYQVVDDWMKLVRSTFWAINNLIIWHKGGGGMWDCLRTLAQDYEILIVVNRGNEIQWYRWWAMWMWNTEEKELFLKKASKESMKQVLENISKSPVIWKVGKDDTMSYLHPTQKPVEINQRVLENFTAENENVLDLFGWSWSNLIACEKTNRRCFMMELDPKYAQVIIQRYHEYTWWQNKIVCLNRELDVYEYIKDPEEE